MRFCLCLSYFTFLKVKLKCFRFFKLAVVKFFSNLIFSFFAPNGVIKICRCFCAVPFLQLFALGKDKGSSTKKCNISSKTTTHVSGNELATNVYLFFAARKTDFKSVFFQFLLFGFFFLFLARKLWRCVRLASFGKVVLFCCFLLVVFFSFLCLFGTMSSCDNRARNVSGRVFRFEFLSRGMMISLKW